MNAEASPLATVVLVAVLVALVWLGMRAAEWWWARRMLRRLPPSQLVDGDVQRRHLIDHDVRRRHLERIRREAEGMRR